MPSHTTTPEIRPPSAGLTIDMYIIIQNEQPVSALEALVEDETAEPDYIFYIVDLEGGVANLDAPICVAYEMDEARHICDLLNGESAEFTARLTKLKGEVDGRSDIRHSNKTRRST